MDFVDPRDLDLRWSSSPESPASHISSPAGSSPLNLEVSRSSWSPPSLPFSPIVPSTYLHSRSNSEEKHNTIALLPIPSPEDCFSPILTIRDDLVLLYFRHVHAIFPVVDEYSFMESYNAHKNKPELLDHLDLILIQAVIFAGFAHINNDQLKKTPFKSVHEGQQVLFARIKALYRSCSGAVTVDPYTLAQVTIILSLWSPCDSESQVNSYWVARAFHHAQEDMQLSPERRKDIETLRCRRQILWWCCLIRERMLAIGMRRPNRILRKGFDLSLPSEKDFGLEIMFPRSGTQRRKKQHVVMFVLLCKLSIIMEEIAVFQTRVTFARNWSASASVITIEDVRQLARFEQELKRWRSELDEATLDKVQRRTKRSNIALIYILSIMSDSLLAGLYRPYLSHSVAPEFQTVADISPLEVVKTSSREVARNLNTLLAIEKLEGIPSYLIAWTALPTAVDYVLHHVQGTSFQDSGLKDFLLNLRSRYQAAEFVCLLLEEAINNLPEEESIGSRQLEFFDLIDYALQQPAYEGLYLRHKDSNAKPQEAELLDRVANQIDFGLANDIKGLQISDS